MYFCPVKLYFSKPFTTEEDLFPFWNDVQIKIFNLSGDEIRLPSSRQLLCLLPRNTWQLYVPILVYMDSISRVTTNESLGFFSFDNVYKRSSVFFTKHLRLFAIAFKWESIYSDILYDSDPKSEIIGRPGGGFAS